MFEKLKADIFFNALLKRHNIKKAHKMVPPTDSWYDTISTVHRSLAEIQQLPHETLEITSHDGLKLKGIYYPNNSNKTMIWIHGYTSHAERESAFPSLFYRSMGFNILIPYLRAHGPSQGRYLTFGALETFDMQLWVDKINQMHPDGQILIHGLSMGGGIALNMSATPMQNVKGLIVDAPNYNIELAFHNIAREVFRENADIIAEIALKRFNKQFKCNASDFDSVKIVSQSNYPILLSAGSNEHCEELFEQIKNANPMETSIVILPGCNHGNGMYKQTNMYQGAIKDFLAKNFD